MATQGGERRWTEVGNCRVHSVHAGTGPPLVLLHGLAGSQGWWRYTTGAFAEQYSVQIPDLVGFGRSVGERPGTIADMAALLEGWLEVIGVTRAHVVGHSMGGQIAIHLAARAPQVVDRLVLVGATGIPRPFRLADLVRFAAEVVPPRAWGRATFLPRIAGDAARAGPRVLWSALRTLLIDDVRSLLPQVRSDTLLLIGEMDPLVPRRHALEMVRLIPSARLVVVEGAAHNPMVDRPASFLRTVLPFLAGTA